VYVYVLVIVIVAVLAAAPSAPIAQYNIHSIAVQGMYLTAVTDVNGGLATCAQATGTPFLVSGNRTGRTPSTVPPTRRK
jgi:hypothetical protein